MTIMKYKIYIELKYIPHFLGSVYDEAFSGILGSWDFTKFDPLQLILH